jgi:hypothetical protein
MGREGGLVREPGRLFFRLFASCSTPPSYVRNGDEIGQKLRRNIGRAGKELLPKIVRQGCAVGRGCSTLQRLCDAGGAGADVLSHARFNPYGPHQPVLFDDSESWFACLSKLHGCQRCRSAALADEVWTWELSERIE